MRTIGSIVVFGFLVSGAALLQAHPEDAENDQVVRSVTTDLKRIGKSDLDLLRDAKPVGQVVDAKSPMGQSKSRTAEQPSSRKDENDLSSNQVGVPSPADLSKSPFKYGGILLFRKADGLSNRCSAQFVGEKNILLTAAHCVRDPKSGKFYEITGFYRAFNENTFAKKFTAACMGTKSGWVSTSDERYQYDYAFIRTTEDSDVGYMGYQTFQNESTWTEFGYPGNFGGGQVMQKVTGTFGQILNGEVEMKGNPMRNGNSGGAWFYQKSGGEQRGNWQSIQQPQRKQR